MPPHTVITEIDADESSIEQKLDQLLDAHNGDPKKLLATVFNFLSGHTRFFDDPEVSKVLARLLRDTKKAAGPQAQPSPPKQSSVPQSQPVTTAAPTAAVPSSSSKVAAEAGPVVEADEGDKEPDSKGLKPNAGNGANLEHYSWTQSLADVNIIVPVPKGTKGRDCTVEISKTGLKVGLKGQPPILSGALSKAVKPEESLWSLDSSTIELTLQKVDNMSWWGAVLQGEPEIDTSKVMPENSKLSDLDGETRATVEKMMFDQRQKQLGLPTSEEAQKQEMLQKFMAAHPEMDFSKAKFA